MIVSQMSCLSEPKSMASSLSFFLCFFSLLSLLSKISPSPTTTTLPVSHCNPDPSSDSVKKLSHLVATSLARVHHIKNSKIAPSTSTTPLYSHSYGGYSVSLSLGTPPQTIPFVMDTGSDLVWFPCTQRYVCKNCSFSSSSTGSPKIPTFLPKLSSSSKVLGCLNPKCSWIHDSDVNSRCSDCTPNLKNCTQICPPYLILYGSGSTGGIALLETLNLPSEKIPGFLVGCSIFSSRQPAGIAGFGRGETSLPSQLGLKKFSYCLLSRQFDDTNESSSLVLDGESDSGHKTDGVSYTPFIKNPTTTTGKRAFSVYYYVGLRKIIVGGTRVKVPHKYLRPASDGNGGTIVDSGTTFTYMARELFEPVASELEKQVKGYARSYAVEALTGLRPCYNVTGVETLSFPELVFHFKGAADMALPLENFFTLAGGTGAACLTILTDTGPGRVELVGPAIILGNFQQQNFYIEYDLRNKRFGFKRQACN